MFIEGTQCPLYGCGAGVAYPIDGEASQCHLGKAEQQGDKSIQEGDNFGVDERHWVFLPQCQRT